MQIPNRPNSRIFKKGMPVGARGYLRVPEAFKEASFYADFTTQDYAYGTNLVNAATFSEAFDYGRDSVGYAFNPAGTLTEYAVDVPRFDHDPLTGARKGLLIEPAQTNLALWSEASESGTARWQPSPVASNTVTAATQKYLPVGAQGAFKITPTTDNNAHLYFDVHAAVAVNTPVELWAVVEAAGYTHVEFALTNSGYPANGLAVFALSGDGAVTEQGAGANSASIEHIGGGLYLAKVNVTADADGGNLVAVIRALPTGVSQSSYAGDGTSAIIVHHVQVGAPGSPILTAGATASHAADLLEVKPAVVADVWNDEEWTIVLDFVPYATGLTKRVFTAMAATADNRVQMVIAADGVMRVAVVTGGVIEVGGLSVGASAVFGSLSKVAISRIDDALYLSHSGGAVQSTTGVSFPTGISNFFVGQNQTGGDVAALNAEALTVFPRGYSGAQLQSLSS